MNSKLYMKDVNKILTKKHFKWFFKWCKETIHFCGNMSLWSCWKSPRHAFTSPSYTLREKSSLCVVLVVKKNMLLKFLNNSEFCLQLLKLQAMFCLWLKELISMPDIVQDFMFIIGFQHTKDLFTLVSQQDQ